MAWSRPVARASTSKSLRSRSTAPAPNERSTERFARRSRSRGDALAVVRRLAPDLLGRELVVRAAKLAGHRDHTVFHHVVAVVLREIAQHGLDAIARTRASG